MSQWVKATSKVMEHIDKSVMTRTFEKMNIAPDYSVNVLQNRFGKAEVDFALRDLKDNNKLMDIGMKLDKNKAEARGDFYFSRWANSDAFINDFSRMYQRINIEDTAIANGYNVEQENVKQDGSIELYLTANVF